MAASVTAPRGSLRVELLTLIPVISVLLLVGACSSGDGGEKTAAATDTVVVASPPTPAEIEKFQIIRDVEGRVGRWTRVRSGASADELTSDQRRQIRRLESLGYVGGSKLAPTMKSVVVHDPQRAHPGLNLFTSGHAPEALLMDMDGQVLHHWALSYWETWPDSEVDRSDRDTQFWRRARVLPNGDLVAVFGGGLGILKLDRHSNLLWARQNNAHHDLELLPDGDILVLAREANLVPQVHPSDPILEDFILRLGPDGQEKIRVSLLDCFVNSEGHGQIWNKNWKRSGDIFHTNSLELLDGRIADRVPEFAAGRVLISIRRLNTVAVVDLEQVEVVWAFRARFKAQHDATILPDGNLMLFNNAFQPGASSVNIYDLTTGRRVWRFNGTEERPFYSKSCGTSQMLPNGNVLITESDNGRAFEIDADGVTVWEFYNPYRAGDDQEFIATIFEMLRLPLDFPVDWADASLRRR